MRELLCKRSEIASTKAPIEFAENPRLPETATTTSGAESQSGSNMELGGRILNVVGENANEDEQRGVGVEKMGQDLEECNLEFLIIEKQI